MHSPNCYRASGTLDGENSPPNEPTLRLSFSDPTLTELKSLTHRRPHSNPAGIHVCAERVDEEIRAILKEKPSLRFLTIIGYSLGGLIGRYMVGSLHVKDFYGAPRPLSFLSAHPSVFRQHILVPLFCDDRWPVLSAGPPLAGLAPINFITLACPHLVRLYPHAPFTSKQPVLTRSQYHYHRHRHHHHHTEALAIVFLSRLC